MGRTPSVSSHSAISRASSGSRAPRWRVAAAWGSSAASLARSTLPIGVSGTLAIVWNAEGTMKAGSRLLRNSRSTPGSSVAPGRGTT